MTQDRERRLIDAFLVATGTLVGDYDVVEMLQTLVDEITELFGLDAAGITLADDRQELEVVAATSERAALLELMQLESREGPCIEASVSGTPRSAASPDEMRRQWPRFAAAAEHAGFASVHSVPMRSRETVLGAVNLFRSAPGRLDDRDLAAIRALTDVATIAVLQQRSADHAALAQQRLQQALDSRVLIEQAKGFLAHTHRIEPDEAFALLRRWARANNVLLHEAARGVTEGRVDIPVAHAAPAGTLPDEH